MPLQLPPGDLDHIMARTRPLWAALGQGNLLLTGGTGFIGKWLLGSWLHARDLYGFRGELWVVSRDPARFLNEYPELRDHPFIHWLKGDVRDREWWASTPFRYVIHGATDASAALIREAPLEMFDVCSQGTRSVLEMLHSARASKQPENAAPRVLLLSSGAVYGPQPPDMTHVAEEYIGAPDCTRVGNAYAEGKRVAEWLAAHATERWDLPVITARAFAFLGPHLPLDAHYAAGNFIHDALAYAPIRVNGDGTPVRSYLYAADLCIWLWHILMRGEPGRAYNVGSDREISILQMAHKVAQVGGALGVQMARPEQTAPSGPPARYVPDITRARRELGLDIWIGLEEGIRRTLDWGWELNPPTRMGGNSR